MKKSRAVIVFACLLFTLLFSGTVFASKAKAAVVANVMQAPKTYAGQWVRTSYGFRYRYTSNGQYARNLLANVNGKIYYFRPNGVVYTGWLDFRGGRYFFNGSGQLQTGWQTIRGYRFYFQPSTGKATMGKACISGKYYYFSPNGIMQTGLKKVGQLYYYMDPKTGELAINKWVGRYYFGNAGQLVKVASTAPQQASAQKEVDLFVGDSRTVGMCAAVHGDNCKKCIAKVGANYVWLTSVCSSIMQVLNSNPTATVVFGLGVNDVELSEKYIAFYRLLMSKYPKATFYFLSVNPVSTNFRGWFDYTTMTKWINTFNTAMKKAFPRNYLDCASYLQKIGFTTVDGLHYTTQTYKDIYEFILSNI